MVAASSSAAASSVSTTGALRFLDLGVSGLVIGPVSFSAAVLAPFFLLAATDCFAGAFALVSFVEELAFLFGTAGFLKESVYLAN